MPPVDRKNPQRSKSSDSRYSLMEFMREFPDDDTCLEHLWRSRFADDGEHAHCPKCDKRRSFKRYATAQRRQSWTCTACGHHIQPTAGTVFHKSSTSLVLWFYACYLMTSTKCGVSAKHLERELGVTYKTAWRMLNLIRNKLMAQDAEPPLGERSETVEADETWWGGKPKASQTRGMTRPEAITYAKARKTPVVGVVERDGKARLLVSRAGERAPDAVRKHVHPNARLVTDDWVGYHKMGHPGEHETIAHSERVYASGDVHTNTVEGFFGNVKNGIAGNYHGVSRKWLQGYLNEYAWRLNHRDDARADFQTLIERTAS
jgi:transposase-like protein